MNEFWFGLGVLALATLFYISLTPKKNFGLKDNAEVRELSNYVGPAKILTPYERKMFRLLKESIPKNYSVMCQVSFNAFLKCDDMSTRNKFNRCMVDFLIIDENFIPILVVELDDFTHLNETTKLKDKFRDNLLSAALIPTVRFAGLPKSSATVKSRINIHFKQKKKSPVYKKLVHAK